jgi:REP element-mobilizing transposase RayT
MKKDSVIYRRRSLRLKDYYYSQEGAYFITICAYNRLCLFGEIANGIMIPNEIAMMIDKWWIKFPQKFPPVEIDYNVIMPNHFHGIIIINNHNTSIEKGARAGAPLHKIIQWFKTMTTNDYIKWKNQNKRPRSSGGLWQRNYYEYIIRNEDDLYNTRKYIEENPLKWEIDSEYRKI